MNIARADKLGSGVRNLYAFTKIYSGGEPELVEGDIFKTTIPLSGIAAEKLPDNLPNPRKNTKKLPNNLPDKLPNKLTRAETAFMNDLSPLFAQSEWITNTEAREASGKSEGSVKRFMRNLTEKGALVATGETKDRRYSLHKKA